MNFLKIQKPFFIQFLKLKKVLKCFRCLGLINLMSIYCLYPTYPHGPPIMYHLPQLFVPVFPEKCKQNYLPSSLYRGKLFSRPSLGQWGEIISERTIYFCTLLLSQQFSKNFNKTFFLWNCKSTKIVIQLQIYFYPIVSSTMSTVYYY